MNFEMVPYFLWENDVRAPLSAEELPIINCPAGLDFNEK
jgi:hypothetical protein